MDEVSTNQGSTDAASTSGGGVTDEARITLLTRPGCHLCEFAREAVARVQAATGVGWTEVNVESDPDLERDYGGRVPVVLLDGREHDYFRVDEDRLTRAIMA